MVLTYIVLPTRSTSGRTRHSVTDTILETHRTTVLQTVVGNDVVTEDVHILLNRRTQILHQILTVLNEVRIDIILQSADTIVVLNQTSTCGLLHHVKHMLTVTHTIKHTSKSTEVLSHTRGVEQVGIETLKLVHNRTDVLDTVCQLNAKSFLNYTNQSMAMLHGSQIVKTIRQSKSLRIGHAFPHLLDSTVDIAQMRINALYGFAVKNGLQAQYAMGCWVLRTDIDDIVIGTKELVLL